MTLHPQVKDRLDDIERIVIETQEPGVRIIDKTGPLANPADRDHCIQYMVAIPLIFGRLTAEDYEDEVAARSAHRCAAREDAGAREPDLHAGYYAADKRYIGNAVQVFFRDGSATPRVQVDFPIGHRKRRAEGMPVLVKKFEASVAAHFPPKQAERIKAAVRHAARSWTHAGQRAHGDAGHQRRRRRLENGAGPRPEGRSGGGPEACRTRLLQPTRTGTKMRASPRWISSAM